MRVETENYMNIERRETVRAEARKLRKQFLRYKEAEIVYSMQHDFIAYRMGQEYYGLGEKPMIRMAWESGAVYKVGKKVLIRREIFEAYLREHRKKVEELRNGDVT